MFYLKLNNLDELVNKGNKMRLFGVCDQEGGGTIPFTSKI